MTANSSKVPHLFCMLHISQIAELLRCRPQHFCEELILFQNLKQHPPNSYLFTFFRINHNDLAYCVCVCVLFLACQMCERFNKVNVLSLKSWQIALCLCIAYWKPLTLSWIINHGLSMDYFVRINLDFYNTLNLWTNSVCASIRSDCFGNFTKRRQHDLLSSFYWIFFKYFFSASQHTWSLHLSSNINTLARFRDMQ